MWQWTATYSFAQLSVTCGVSVQTRERRHAVAELKEQLRHEKLQLAVEGRYASLDLHLWHNSHHHQQLSYDNRSSSTAIALHRNL